MSSAGSSEGDAKGSDEAIADVDGNVSLGGPRGGALPKTANYRIFSITSCCGSSWVITRLALLLRTSQRIDLYTLLISIARHSSSGFASSFCASARTT